MFMFLILIFRLFVLGLLVSCMFLVWGLVVGI
jgi:hypothetical protein